jgi:hypothetical protein
VIPAIIGLLWLCAIGIRNLESRFLWAGTSRAIPQIDGTNLPIRDFKWDELRLGDVAGMEELYSTRIGKVFSPSGGVAPKINVVKYMKELCLRSPPPRASASPTRPSATKTASGALRLNSAPIRLRSCRRVCGAFAADFGIMCA